MINRTLFLNEVRVQQEHSEQILCVKLLCAGTITQPQDEWGLWMRCVCLYESGRKDRVEGTERRSRGTRGKRFSRWDLICETVHPKETFSHGLTPWIQIQPTSRSGLEGRTHLASTRSGEVQAAFLFLPLLLVLSNHDTRLRWLHASSYESSIHTFGL